MSGKISKERYDQAVAKCKNTMAQMKSLRYEVAREAIVVCWRRERGGSWKMPRWAYSIEAFAKDIGLKHGTLKTWIEQWENVISKLPKNEQSNYDLAAVRSAMFGHSRITPKETVNKVYFAAKNKLKDPDAARLIAYTKQLKTVKFGICDQMALNMVDQDDLKDLHNLMETCAAELRGHFSEGL